jgi:prepilin-type N-terminal cleavage/methylation domain-containing protein
MSRRGQSGFTMIEMVIAMALSTFVLGVTVTAFVSLMGEDRTIAEHNDAQEEARLGIDRLSRQLRNLASPTALRNLRENRPRSIEAAGPWDLTVRTVDDRAIPAGSQNVANLMRARWCLNSSNPDDEVLYTQTQRWTTALPPAVPAGSACPGAGWDTTTVASRHLVNVRDAAAPRPLFTYNSTLLEQITRVHADLFVDPTPTRRPVEAHVSSGVILRNQNQFPSAAFEVVAIGSSGANQTLRFDGSSSADPEGQTLKYCWFVDPPTPTPDCAITPAPASLKGQGIVLTYSMPPGNHRIVLTVEDPAGLRDETSRSWP